jgi:hypothetical protein
MCAILAPADGGPHDDCLREGTGSAEEHPGSMDEGACLPAPHMFEAPYVAVLLQPVDLGLTGAMQERREGQGMRRSREEEGGEFSTYVAATLLSGVKGPRCRGPHLT